MHRLRLTSQSFEVDCVHYVAARYIDCEWKCEGEIRRGANVFQSETPLAIAYGVAKGLARDIVILVRLYQHYLRAGPVLHRAAYSRSIGSENDADRR